jgi:hypothetical protein
MNPVADEIAPLAFLDRWLGLKQLSPGTQPPKGGTTNEGVGWTPACGYLHSSS